MHRFGFQWRPLAVGLGLWITSLVAQAQTAAVALSKPGLVPQDSINAADTSWMMTSTALVLLMTLPGIALFYGGMVRRKSVLNTMASVVAIAAVVSLLWFAVGYSLAFTPGSPWLGGTERMGFSGLGYLKEAGLVAVSHVAPNIPESVYAMFQLTFTVITCALIVGALVERMRFSAMLFFISLWSLVVYAPIAHWVWEPGGWLAQLGVLDFAGGSVVHINAGVSGLVAGLVAITPAAGFVTPANAVVIGGVAGLACYWGATGLKRMLQADDSLDVFGVHGIGGIVGALMTGYYASPLISGATGSVATQALGVLAVVLYSAVVSAVLLWLTNFLIGLRVDNDAEQMGLDVSQHREHMGT
jgi:ammonia channel protein AmtB